MAAFHCILTSTIFLFLTILPSSSFTTTSITAHNRPKFSFTNSALFGRVKKGSLFKNVDADDELTAKKKKPLKKPKTPPPTKRTSASSSSNKGVSPALAQWATQAATQSTTTTTPPPETENDDDVVSEYSTFKEKKKSGRRERQREKQKVATIEKEKLSALLVQLQDALADAKDVTGVLDVVAQIIREGYGRVPTRTVTASPATRDYKMAWVGSDEAVCHVGTGLHNVPLARLQEVFMTLGKSRMEVSEVIRILGPFPNVKNVLKGKVDVNGKSGGMSITYDSMIDGTGKEILAGKEENKKVVGLDVIFASEDFIVCKVPAEDGSETSEDVCEENGKDIILFLKEDDMDAELESYRVL